MKKRVSLTLFIFSLLFLLNSCDLLNNAFKIEKAIPQKNSLTGQPLGMPPTGGVTLDINQILILGTFWVEGGNPLISSKKNLLIEGNHLLCNEQRLGTTKNAVDVHMHCLHDFPPYTIKNKTQFISNGKTYTITSPTTITGDGVTFTLVPPPTLDQMTHPGTRPGENTGLWIDLRNAFPNAPSLDGETLRPVHATVLYFSHDYTVCTTEITSSSENFPSIRSTCPSANFHPYTIDDDTHITIEGDMYARISSISFSDGIRTFYPLAVYY